MSIIKNLSEDNIFNDIAFGLYEIIYKAKYVYKYENLRTTKKYKYTKIYESELAELKSKYDILMTRLEQDEHFFTYVLEFIIFLRTMEKSIFYKNDESRLLYAYTSDDGSVASLRYRDPIGVKDKEDYDITVKFEESKINNILSKGSSVIYNNDDAKLRFIEIAIDRKFGKEMVSKIRYIYPDGNPQLEDKSDEIMYLNTIVILRKEMLELLDYILTRICYTILGSSVVQWKDLINNGLYSSK